MRQRDVLQLDTCARQLGDAVKLASSQRAPVNIAEGDVADRWPAIFCVTGIRQDVVVEFVDGEFRSEASPGLNAGSGGIPLGSSSTVVVEPRVARGLEASSRCACSKRFSRFRRASTCDGDGTSTPTTEEEVRSESDVWLLRYVSGGDAIGEAGDGGGTRRSEATSC